MLLSLTVFMNIVSELMPITSDAVPLIGKQTPPGKHYTSHIRLPPTLLGGLSLCLTLHLIPELELQSFHNHGQGPRPLLGLVLVESASYCFHI